MPPKAKGKKAPILIEGIDTTEMNNPQLQQYMMQIYEKLLKEREERSFFQLERDKLRTFWEITRTQLDEARAQVRNKDYALELAEEKRLKDLNEVDQKVKYLNYEQSLQLTQAAIREKDSLITAEKDFNEQQLELLADKKELKASLKALEELHSQENKALRLFNAEEKTDLRKEFESRIEDMMHKFDKKVFELRSQLESKHKLEMMELEERKNAHIKHLTEDHDRAFNDIRNYYNNITLNNFSLITSLKDNIEDIKCKDAIKEKQLREVLKENKSLLDDISKGKSKMANLLHQLAAYRKESMKISSMKRDLLKTKAALDKLTWDYELLNLLFESSKAEKVKSENEKAMQALELQRDVGGRVTYLEEKIKATRGQVERREHVIADIRRVLQNSRQMGDRSPNIRELISILGNYDEQRSRRMTHRQSLFL